MISGHKIESEAMAVFTVPPKLVVASDLAEQAECSKL